MPESVEEALSIVTVTHPAQLLHAPQVYESACHVLATSKDAFASNIDDVVERARQMPTNKSSWVPAKARNAIRLINVARRFPKTKELIQLVPHAFYVLGRSLYADHTLWGEWLAQLNPSDCSMYQEVVKKWLEPNWVMVPLRVYCDTMRKYYELEGEALGTFCDHEEVKGCFSVSYPGLMRCDSRAESYRDPQLFGQGAFDPLLDVDALIKHCFRRGAAPESEPCKGCKRQLEENHRALRAEWWTEFVETFKDWPFNGTSSNLAAWHIGGEVPNAVVPPPVVMNVDQTRGEDTRTMLVADYPEAAPLLQILYSATCSDSDG